MKSWVDKWIVFILAGIFILICLGPSVVQAQKVIKIGEINPLTGPAAPWGLNTQCGMEAAKKLINDRGGVTVKGQKYEVDFIYADDKYTVAGGRSAGEKLLYTDRVDYFVGSFGVEPLAGWAPLAHKEKKLAIIGGGPIEPKPEWPYVFHLSATDGERSEALCRLMKENLGCKSVLYIMTDDLVGKQAKEGAIKTEKSRGLEVKGYLVVPPNTTDFYPFLTKELKSNPDYLHCHMPPGSVALVVKQSRELGYKGYIGYPTSLPGDVERWQGIAGVEATKGFIGISLALEMLNPMGFEYHAIYEKMCPKYKMTDYAYPMQPYILLKAIEQAQSFDPDDILKVLRTHEFEGLYKTPLKASGEKTYGIKNQMTVPVPYSMIVGKGQLKFLGSALVLTP